MQESFQDATSRSYGYLLCDLKPDRLPVEDQHFPRGDSDTLKSKRYKRAVSQRYSSVEHGPATEKEPRFSETSHQVHSGSTESNFKSSRRRLSENHL